MKVYELRDPPGLGTRSHPWVGSTSDPDLRMLDLRSFPELIRTALEDFRPFEQDPAIHTFYALLEWLNGPGSVLESNDCAFDGPSASDTLGKRLEVTGRVMLLFRDLARNTVPEEVHALVHQLARSASEIDPDFEWGAVAVTSAAVRFTALAEGHQAGHQLLVSFWAWGDDRDEVMGNLDRVFRNLIQALQITEGSSRVTDRSDRRR